MKKVWERFIFGDKVMYLNKSRIKKILNNSIIFEDNEILEFNSAKKLIKKVKVHYTGMYCDKNYMICNKDNDCYNDLQSISCETIAETIWNTFASKLYDITYDVDDVTIEELKVGSKKEEQKEQGDDVIIKFLLCMIPFIVFLFPVLEAMDDPVGKAIKEEQQRMQLQQTQTVCNCKTTADNCQMLCKKHNRKKSDK